MSGRVESRSARRNRKTRALAKVARAAMNQQQQRPRRRRRRPRARALPRGIMDDSVVNTQQNGVIAADDSTHLLPFRPMASGTRKMMAGSGIAQRMSPLPERAIEFVHRHCNPCGEMHTFSENSKVPDGALPNSTILELREALIVRIPTFGGTISLDGAMWTLTVIHLPLFRTPIILVANLLNAEMGDDDRSALISDWNETEDPPVYPNWREIITDSTYYCVVQWSGLNNVSAPTSTGTRDIQQFRICNDGMTIFNNTPDLVNQGMVIGAQWPTNVAKTAEEASDDAVGYTGNIRVNTGATQTANGSRALMRIPIPVDVSTLAIVSSTGTIQVMGVTHSAYPWGHLIYIADTAGTVNNATFTAEASHDMLLNAVAISKGDTITFSVSRTAANVWTYTATNSTTSTQIFTGTAAAPNDRYTLVVTDALEMPLITTFQLPPTDTQNIIQSTPKAVYMSAKEQNGVYMVKRIFQPVFNVQEANERRQVVMTDPDFERAFTFAPLDVFDLNFGIGVTVWSSIPTSCAPAIKLIRDVEVVAGQGSDLMLFMKSNPDECQAAIAICHLMSKHHPFLYPESYNILGGLMNIIGGVVSKIPILGNVVQALPGIVSGILGGEQKSVSGASQNRLESTNVVELAKLAQQLMAQMNIRA